jgi:signal transduction histidine kinase
MSERREAQAVTQLLNLRLKTALARRTAQLRKERQLDKLKDEFVAVASHELKTPITSIKAFAHLLDENLTRHRDPETAQLAARIDSHADKLTRLVNELLDVSRIEAGELSLYRSRFDLSAMLRKLIADFQLTVPTHQIDAEVGPRRMVLADQTRLEQAVLNLLTNAVKYSPEADSIIVRSSAGGGAVTLSVQDFGPGIPQRDQAKVFDRFYRVADTSRKKQTVSGIGLGLYITAEIIREHGGKLWVQSRPGKGCTFSFTLPLK